MTEDGLTFADAPDRGRYELMRDGELVGWLDYRDRDGVRALVHAEVDRRHEGRGLGSELVRRSLEATRSDGLDVVPICSFVRHRMSAP